MAKKYLVQKTVFIILFAFSILSLLYFSLHATKVTPLQNIMGVSGLVAMVLMTWQFILGIRVASASWIKDFFRVNKWHKRLGIGTLILIILHPMAVEIAYALQGIQNFENGGLNIFSIAVQLGSIARILLLIIIIASFILRTKIKKYLFMLISLGIEKIKKTSRNDTFKNLLTQLLSLIGKIFSSYRIWYRVHLLAYFTMVAVWIHAWFTGTKINTIPAIRTYWIVLGVVILLVGIARLLQAFGLFQKHAKVLSNICITSDIYEIKLQLPRYIAYTHGQFVYLQYKRLGESHPFTILSYDNETHVLRIAYKIIGRFTRELSHIQPEKTVFVDGPYGTFTSDMPQDGTPVYCIAGGIGITPFYSFSQDNNSESVGLIYLNRTFLESPYESDLDGFLGDHLTNVFSRENAQTPHSQINTLHSNAILGQRIDATSLKNIVGDDLLKAHYYICGSAIVIDSIKNILLSLGVKSKNIHREPFEM